MQLTDYYSLQGTGVHFSPEQGCRFAKLIAHDFNAIHNANASRFCVPGDLLFAFMLKHLGLYQSMQFRFCEPVNGKQTLYLNQDDNTKAALVDAQEKVYTALNYAGECTQNAALITQLTVDYARFSGHNFPHVLVPLLQEHDLMLNPTRPLVMYQSMALHFDALPQAKLELNFERGEFTGKGRRGEANLHFSLTENGKIIGRGQKTLALGSLQPYQAAESEQLIARYNASSADYIQASLAC